MPIIERKYIFYICAGAFALLVANVLVWFNRTVYDPDRFVEVAVEGITSESSRDAIAGKLTDRLLQNRPALKATIDDRLTKILSGLLDSNGLKRIYSAAANELYLAINAENPKPVTINLSSFKAVVVSIVNAVGQESQNTTEAISTIESLPDNLTVFDPSNIPNIHKFGEVSLWLGPLILVFGLVMYAVPFYHFRNSNQLKLILLFEGVGMAGVAFVSVLLGRSIKSPIISNINDEYARVVATNIYQTFVNSFNAQSRYIFAIGLILIMIYIVWSFRSETTT